MLPVATVDVERPRMPAMELELAWMATSALLLTSTSEELMVVVPAELRVAIKPMTEKQPEASPLEIWM